MAYIITQFSVFSISLDHSQLLSFCPETFLLFLFTLILTHFIAHLMILHQMNHMEFPLTHYFHFLIVNLSLLRLLFRIYSSLILIVIIIHFWYEYIHLMVELAPYSTLFQTQIHFGFLVPFLSRSFLFNNPYFSKTYLYGLLRLPLSLDSNSIALLIFH